MTANAITEDSFGVWGTTAVLLVTVLSPRSGRAASPSAYLADVELACSRFRPDSELTRLNRPAASR